MTHRTAHKIMQGLREALAFAKGDTTKARVTNFTECRDCGNVVRVAARCSECGARLYGAHSETAHDKEEDGAA